MLGIKLLRLCLLVFFLSMVPFAASAQLVEISSAQWSKAQTFKLCTEGNCETFRNIKLSANTIALGEDISIVNTQTGETISNILVKSIRYGSKVKMCWLLDSDGQSGTYITVGGCKM